MKTGNNYCLLLGSDMNRDRALLGAARSTDLPIAVMYKNGNVNSHRFADLILAGDANKTADVLAAIQRLESERGAKPVSVIPLTEMSVIPGLAVSEKYGLPYLSKETVSKVRDKFAMKREFVKYGLPTPRFAQFKTLDELKLLASDFGFPCVVKPRNAGGSEGVRMVRNEQEIQACFESLVEQSNTNKAAYNTEDSLFQVEEYVEASYEVSVEVLNTPNGRSVIAVTDKFLSKPPFFVELGHVIPSRFSDNDKIKQYALAACDSLKLDRGMAHVELKVFDNNDATLIEVNARPGGDNIMDLAERATGLNLFQLHCSSFAVDGFKFEQSCSSKSASAIAFMRADIGTITNIEVPNHSELESNICAVKIWAKQGDYSGEWRNSHNRQGAVEFYWEEAASRSSFEQCQKKAQELAKKYITVND